MTTFTEADHPRGQAANPGQFRPKTNAAPLRALNELFTAPPLVADIPHATDQELHNAEIESYYRQGDREISDEAAIAIMRDVLHHFPADVQGGPDGETHQMRLVAAGTPINPSDHNAVDELHTELGRVYNRGAGSGLWGNRDRRIDSLFTWSLHGGDNTP